MITPTIEQLLHEYPALAEFAQFLFSQTKNPTIKPEDRKKAELVLRDIRLLSSKVRESARK